MRSVSFSSVIIFVVLLAVSFLAWKTIVTPALSSCNYWQNEIHKLKGIVQLMQKSIIDAASISSDSSSTERAASSFCLPSINNSNRYFVNYTECANYCAHRFPFSSSSSSSFNSSSSSPSSVNSSLSSSLSSSFTNCSIPECARLFPFFFSNGSSTSNSLSSSSSLADRHRNVTLSSFSNCAQTCQYAFTPALGSAFSSSSYWSASNPPITFADCLQRCMLNFPPLNHSSSSSSSLSSSNSSSLSSSHSDSRCSLTVCKSLWERANSSTTNSSSTSSPSLNSSSLSSSLPLLPPHPSIFTQLSPLHLSDQCERLCHWTYDRFPRGVSISYSTTLGQMVSPVAYRDLCDYVFEWPFQHFHEPVSRPDFRSIVSCLRPGAFIFVHTGPAIRAFKEQMAPLLSQKFILVTGQSDYDPLDFAGDLENHPHLLHWFAQNGPINHPKITPIPLGEQVLDPPGQELASLLRTYNQSSIPRKLAVANWGPTHPHRKEVSDRLCGKGFVECIPKMSDPMPKVFEKLSDFWFWFAPRGNGVDTHRLWETLYLNRIPILEHSTMDVFFKDNDTLVYIVDDMTQMTEAMLWRFLFDNRDRIGKTQRRKLTFQYWMEVMARTRRRLLGLPDSDEFWSFTETSPGYQCFGRVS
eukprot:TRINITY_DN980_c0_g1_i1.p1 TRINITY_DN980_c0_g1~~TRINITY_DN980_c0_g1_i1.p1  ORF type:complete len:639 (+),score=184.47 TRINITY_DN980_c0_g1_i1:104-2020(+)